MYNASIYSNSWVLLLTSSLAIMCSKRAHPSFINSHRNHKFKDIVANNTIESQSKNGRVSNLIQKKKIHFDLEGHTIKVCGNLL